MQSYISELVEIEKGLDHAVVHLREQQSLVAGLDSPCSRPALLLLLSSGLRMYCWLEDRQRAIAEEIAGFRPVRQP
ncbi:MAG: hypothetical protein Q7T81_17590 [Pseudolabrys sp.]|nr:hypothetical protein [Pseudolabrys sp.]